MREAFLRSFCLGLIVVQNSSLILVTSYSRTLTPAYLPSIAVVLAEVAKLGVAILLLVNESGSCSEACQQLQSLLGAHSSDTLKFAVPAFCYTVQNHLWYYALTNLDPITAAVTSQMKVITTAIASVIMLGRRLSAIQWVSLACLTLGMVVMQLPNDQSPHPTVRSSSTPPGGAGGSVRAPGADRVVPHNSVSGACAMLMATVLSACTHTATRLCPAAPVSHLSDGGLPARSHSTCRRSPMRPRRPPTLAHHPPSTLRIAPLTCRSPLLGLAWQTRVSFWRSSSRRYS